MELLVVTDTKTLVFYKHASCPVRSFSIGSNNYTIVAIYRSGPTATSNLTWVLALDFLTATERAALRLHVCDEDLRLQRLL